ncbi:hypothetical protein CCYA_CCYA08G2273 [Cyanidiococcus yangmingshanensis]|nr:hypothetical protein CCYA_CCYA08G2273 [Cyanidiococcus yangmingshanensis]
MHPVLSTRDHPLCQEFIKRLEDCHRENRVLKFFGRCNECKRDLDRCLGKELLLKRALNYQRSGARRTQETSTFSSTDAVGTPDSTTCSENVSS